MKPSRSYPDGNKATTLIPIKAVISPAPKQAGTGAEHSEAKREIPRTYATSYSVASQEVSRHTPNDDTVKPTQQPQTSEQSVANSPANQSPIGGSPFRLTNKQNINPVGGAGGKTTTTGEPPSASELVNTIEKTLTGEPPSASELVNTIEKTLTGEQSVANSPRKLSTMKTLTHNSGSGKKQYTPRRGVYTKLKKMIRSVKT